MTMKILGIESSCDDTAAAVVEDGVRILSNVVSSQDDLHRRFGGIVPEIACRAHIENVLPVVQQAADDACLGFEAMDAVAVTTHPGLIGALLIGLTAAKAASWALEKPLIAVNHLEAHIYGAWLSGRTPALPAVSLVVSGGHTSLFLTTDILSHKRIGATTDDAAGEAFDKVANVLKLGFPGGPAIERAARVGDPGAVRLPRAWLDRDTLDFSFSGVKTAVLYHCLGQNASKHEIEDAQYSPEFVADVAASFQEAIVDVLVQKTCAAAEKTGAVGIIMGGGVGSNSLLRERMGDEARARGLDLTLTPPRLCRDNAAIVAGLGFHLYAAGRTADLRVEATP
jgi:N6-L-threonylcarbamoyladenine synthase